MKILFTGAEGFLGSNVVPILRGKGFEVKTLGLQGCDYNVDITKEIEPIKEEFDLVFHAAGKAHTVPKNREEEDIFYKVNLEGTKNICKAIQNFLPKSFVFVSTVAVYGCDTGLNIDEEQPLEGKTPYAKSKLLAEQFLTDWSKNNNVYLSIIRPSLIAGVDAPGNLGAMVKGIQTGRYLNIAGGKARKSILMVEDIANLIPLLKGKTGIYNVCDDIHPSFRELETVICKQLGKKLPLSIPMWVAKIMAGVGNLLGKNAPINTNKLKKITESLTFSNEKAKKELGWKPLSVLEYFRVK